MRTVVEGQGVLLATITAGSPYTLPGQSEEPLYDSSSMVHFAAFNGKHSAEF